MKKIGFLLLIGLAVAGVGIYFYSRRWQKYEDFNFIGNQKFSNTGFVTDYDTKLAVGDKIEILQDDNERKIPELDGKTEITGFTKTDNGKFIFVTDKPWYGSRPKNGGKWRKLNIV